MNLFAKFVVTDDDYHLIFVFSSSEFQPIEEQTPVHEVTEGDMMHLTVEKPSNVNFIKYKNFKKSSTIISNK